MPLRAIWSADSAIPSEAEAWNSPAIRLRSIYAVGSPALKPPRTPDSGQIDTIQRDGVTTRGAHPERVPIVMHSYPWSIGGHHRVCVTFGAVAVRVANG